MPYVNVQITKGATRKQKSQLVEDITNSLVNVLGKKPEHIHIVIQEIEEENCGATLAMFHRPRNAHQDLRLRNVEYSLNEVNSKLPLSFRSKQHRFYWHLPDRF